MNILKFYYTMGYFPLEMISNEKALLNYKETVFPLIKEFMGKKAYNAYNKNYSLTNLIVTDKALRVFLNTFNNILTSKEKNYLKGYRNLVIQFKRYIREQQPNIFPAVLTNLTDIILKQFLAKLKEKKQISTSIIFLEDPYYLTLYEITVERAIVSENLIFNDPFSKNILDIDEYLYHDLKGLDSLLNEFKDRKKS